MNDERDEIMMSQLADGELTSDQANELLLGVLDAPDEREKLKEFLRLRQATAPWRTSQPPRPVVIVAERRRTFRRSRLAWRTGGLAVAACVGGLLVLTGVWAAGWMGRSVQPNHQGLGAPRAAVQVTPEQMRQVAKVFALHESVAGPLAWYAADDRNIRLASARGTEAGLPAIAVLLKLDPTGGTGSRTVMIVCREDAPAVIELPADMAGHAGLRVYLAPRAVNGSVEMHYAIAVDGQSPQAPAASISGQRRLGTAEAPLGQLTMGDRVLNVEAAAWAMRQEGN